MRSDYGLYIVAVICFIIAGIFLTGAIPGYTFADSMGMVSIAVFLILGIIFAVAGYATKPKVTAIPPVTEPVPTLAEPTPPPAPPPAEEVMPEPEPVAEQPPQEETATQESPMAAEELAPVPPPPPPLASMEETVKTAEEKPARRRRKVKVEDVEGIGSTYAKKLAETGIKTTDDLLEAGTTPKERENLAKKTGISEKLILEWVNLADLFRIKGVGEEYSDLLEEAGVDTVAELATRNADNLHAKILEVNKEKKLVRRPPTLDEIKKWIAQAKTLPRKVEY